MSRYGDDDFATLVSRDNPATFNQYSSSTPTAPRYPPQQNTASSSANYNLDPFFDDDDDQFSPGRGGIDTFASMSTYGNGGASVPMDNLDSTANLPLAKSGVAPAGTSIARGDGTNQWTFDDDTPSISRSSISDSKKKKQSLGKRLLPQDFKWPWQRNKALPPERTIWLNDAPRNSAEGYCSNYVSTSKYNVVTFIPKFLAEQFSKYANVFFLFTAFIQQIPGVSPTNRYTTIVPLGLVLLASAFKETEEDLKRHQSDAELNARKAQVLSESGTFVDQRWREIRVGDVVRLQSDDFIPADLILLASSEPEGLCYIETSNLDGETNLKIKQANTQTAKLTAPHLVAQLNGYMRSEQPNNSLYTYEGTMVLNTNGTERSIPMSPDQILLRGAQLRNTPWAYGLVVFTGHETKLMRNATATPIKRTAVERQVNVQIVFLFILLIVLSLASTIGSSIRTWFFSANQWYLLLKENPTNKARQFVEDILTFVILYNNLIPISLIVTMEVVKFQQAQLINSDLDMYYAKTDTPALCRTSSLVEELGQIEYIFSDKTGTLTRNEMEFRLCSIAGARYSETGADSSADDESGEGTRTFADLKGLAGTDGNGGYSGAGGGKEALVVKEFLTLLAVCHTVIPERKGDKIVYQASSPDEAALVAGAELLGYKFHVSPSKSFICALLLADTLFLPIDAQTEIGVCRNERDISRV
ncbi:hypothetical protein FRC02_008713 [Tulasnella sp. 418]|nr:hypothetical protein FRC02_008713 [Tulasnella sp. 418]